MQRLGRYVLGNIVKAGIFALALLLLPWPFCVTSAVVVGLVALSRGPKDSAYLLSWVILPAVAATWKAPSIAVTYDVAFVLCAMTWLLAVALRYLRNWSRLLELTVALGLCYLGVLQALPTAWVNSATNDLQQLVLGYAAQIMPTDMNFYRDMLSSVAPYLLGGLYSGFALLAIMMLMLARSWQLHIGAAFEHLLELYNIRIDRRITLLAILVIAASYVWQFDWLIVATQLVTLPLLFAGVSVLGFWLKFRAPLSKALRVVCLVLSIICLMLIPKVLLGFMILGVVDSLFNVRKLNLFRIKRASS